MFQFMEEEVYNDAENTNWIIKTLKLIPIKQQPEWLAYRIFYNEYNEDIQKYPIHLLITSLKDLNINKNLSGLDIFNYFISTDLKEILDIRIDIYLQKYCINKYRDYSEYLLTPNNKYLLNYQFCIAVKENIYKIIGEQIYNFLSFGFHKPEQTISPNQQTIKLINSAINKSKDAQKIINIFTDRVISKALLGIQYPLLINIKNNSLPEYQKKYCLQPIQFLENKYFLYKSINVNNVKKITAALQQLKLI